jgi:hypothetical protein
MAGWPGGKAWIDSSSLLTRMQLPKILFRNESLNVNVKDSGDANEEVVKRKNKFEVTMDWNTFAQFYEKIPEANLGKTLASYLLQVPINSSLLKTIENQAIGKSRTEQIQHLTISLMGLPEYQVC